MAISKLKTIIKATASLFSTYLMLVACPLLGQVANKPIPTKAQYHLWGKLQLIKCSESGKWITYKMSYPKAADTTFVMASSIKKTYAFTQIHKLDFIDKDRFLIYQKADKGIFVKDLKSQQEDSFAGFNSYAISKKQKWVYLYHSTTKELFVLNLKNGGKTIFKDVHLWEEHPTKNKIFIVQKQQSVYRSFILDLDSNTQQNIYRSNIPISKAVWHPTKTWVTFMEKQDAVKYIHLFKDKLYTLPKTKVLQSIPKANPSDFTIARVAEYIITNSGNKLLFPIQFAARKPNESKDVEIWHSSDWRPYVQQQILDKSPKSYQVLWDIEKDSVYRITNPRTGKILIHSNRKSAILHGQHSYLPVYQFGGNKTDYVHLNLNTGSRDTLLKKVNYTRDKFFPSPYANYWLYFSQKHWWLYNPNTKQKKCITKKLTDQFSKPHPSKLNDPIPISIPLFHSKNIIYLSGSKNIWAYHVSSNSWQRITNNKKKLHSRIDLLESSKKPIDMSQGFLIRTIDSSSSKNALGWVHPEDKLDIFAFDFQRKKQALHTKTGIVFYTKESFDQPPSLWIKKPGQREKLLFQSNPHHDKFGWGKSKWLSYKGPNNTQLYGSLIYPVNFDPQKKYPLIVYPYQKQSTQHNLFTRPSFLEFNPTNYAHQGYFVLLPDIEFEAQNTGVSASKSVLLAINAALKEKAIDEKRLGYYGYSFGGYLANMMATQTNKFKTIVSGGGYSHLISWGFRNQPGLSYAVEMNFIEFEQGRMEKPFFEIPKAYEKNDPVLQATNIQTPILLYAGKKDSRVNWEESKQFHLLLRRLGKESTLLVYPEGYHALIRPEDQKDFSEKLLQWYDHYLKGKPKASWMKPKNNRLN